MHPAKRRKRRIAKARSVATHTQAEWLAIVAEVNGHCVICARFTASLTKDHIVAIFRGGHDGISNLQPVCRSCNSSKDYDDFNWLEYRRENGWPEVGQLELALPKRSRDKLLHQLDWMDKYGSESMMDMFRSTYV